MLFDLPAQDKGIIFNDFPQVQLLKEGESVPITVRALPSFIGMAEVTDGIEVGADSHEITFDYDNEDVKGIQLSEGDYVSYTNKAGTLIKYKIDRIARDRHLGLWSCYMRIIKLEEEAGLIDRRTDS